MMSASFPPMETRDPQAPPVSAVPASTDAAPLISEELVTVIVPARNEEAAIGPCLDSILAQDHRNLQVIVIDGASTDGTCDVVLRYARRDPRVELLHNPDSIIPRSLNLAVAAARARWLVRVDAHSAITPGYVSRAVRHLRTGRWGGVGGRKDGVGRTAAGRAIAAAMSSRFGVGNSTYHYGTRKQKVEHVPFGAYPVEVIRELGGWDESLRVNQDFELDYRVRMSGRDLLFDPDLVIDWECRQSVRDLFDQYRRYGRGKSVVVRRHPRSIRARHLAAPALVASLACAALVGVRYPRFAAAVATPYLVGLGAATVVTSPKVQGAEAKARLPAAFAAMHVGWGVGFWQGLWDALRGES